LYRNNYLLEKAQYSVSYSGDSNIPNWSAWQLNQSWLKNPSDRPDTDFFIEDPILGSLGWASAKHNDYRDRELSGITPGQMRPDGTPLYKLSPGHLSPNADRGRNLKDANSTFLTSNIVPQHEVHNESIWKSLESFERSLATQQSKEIYIYASGVGEKNPTQDKADIVISNDPTYGSYSLQVPAHLWKVFLILDRPGLGIEDITTTNTKAFAVWTDNTLPQPGSSPYTRWNNGGMNIITISDLENRLNTDANNRARGIRYDFSSSLPSLVQQALKTTSITIPLGTTPYTAFLTADASELDKDSNIIGSTFLFSKESVLESTINKVGTVTNLKTIIDRNISIRHNGVAEDAIEKTTAITDFSSGQIGSSKVDIPHVSIFKISSNKYSISKIGIIQASKGERSSTQIGSFKIGSIQTGLPEITISQVGIGEIDSLQKHFSQNRLTQINTSQVSTNQLIGSIDFDSTEISLPSSIMLQQFLSTNNSLWSSHNPNPQNTTVPSWTEFLQSPTPFNLKVEITDLPTGQLAEATITGYDTTGRPNAGTLTLDINGNNQGWFIDTTPGDNSEFDQIDLKLVSEVIMV
jgi:large repetitive protein